LQQRFLLQQRAELLGHVVAELAGQGA
jgi:hypothetical protein